MFILVEIYYRYIISLNRNTAIEKESVFALAFLSSLINRCIILLSTLVRRWWRVIRAGFLFSFFPPENRAG